VALVTRLFVIGVGIGATVAALIFVVALVIRLLI
jgi:hypothetical protein